MTTRELEDSIAPPPPAAAAGDAVWQQPPRRHGPTGELRQVGCELEFTGLELADIATAVEEVYGGRMVEENQFRFKVEDSDIGDFTLELDWRLLSDALLRQRIDALGLSELGIDPREIQEMTERLESFLGKVAATILPVEVAAPPLPLDRLASLDVLRAVLNERGAIGTGGSIAYAFGLHLNVEAPATDATTLLAYLRAFLLLYEWLVERDEVDLTRRISPFIRPFPKAYVRRLMSDGYEPELAELIDDYLEHNATRNRPLDLLPLFSHLDPERVEAALDEPLVKPRPTFHYRMPNCRIDDPRWRIADEWNLWVVVERLAADAASLEALRQSYGNALGSFLHLFDHRFKSEVDHWLQQAARA